MPLTRLIPENSPNNILLPDNSDSILGHRPDDLLFTEHLDNESRVSIYIMMKIKQNITFTTKSLAEVLEMKLSSVQKEVKKLVDLNMLKRDKQNLTKCGSYWNIELAERAADSALYRFWKKQSIPKDKIHSFIEKIINQNETFTSSQIVGITGLSEQEVLHVLQSMIGDNIITFRDNVYIKINSTYWKNYIVCIKYKYCEYLAHKAMEKITKNPVEWWEEFRKQKELQVKLFEENKVEIW